MKLVNWYQVQTQVKETIFFKKYQSLKIFGQVSANMKAIYKATCTHLPQKIISLSYQTRILA